jgi:transposase
MSVETSGRKRSNPRFALSTTRDHVGLPPLATVEKSARRQDALIVFEDESGISLLPSVRATWAPRGHTPVLRHRFVWKRLSVAGALVYEPDGTDAQLVFQLRPGAYNGETLIEFLSELHTFNPQRAVLVIWAGLPAHRSRRVSDWVTSHRDWLSVEPLPGYAPDLNPVEQVWGNLKSQQLANLCSDTVDQVAGEAELGLNRIGSDASLCLAFLQHTGLYL